MVTEDVGLLPVTLSVFVIRMGTSAHADHANQ